MPRQILMVASEAAPFLRTGGPAEVVVALGEQLCRQGHDVHSSFHSSGT